MPNLDNRPDLTPELAQRIVVDAAPHPDNFKNPGQMLMGLGVIDAQQASLHAARIQSGLNRQGWRIERAKVASGPATTVGACTDSVLDHAL